MNPGTASLPLRDIHLPEPVGWWPPAPGWWLLAGGLLLLLAALAWWRRRRRGSWRRAALEELDRLEQVYRAQGDAVALARALSILLRRAALAAAPRSRVAGLTGSDWLRWLDAQLGGRDFRQGPGRTLVEAPYRPGARLDAEALLALCRRWVKGAARARRGA